MPIGSVLLVSALTFLVFFYLSLPFLTDTDLGEKESSERSSLLAERERVLAAILELEADKELGKVPEDVFAIQKKTLMEKAAEVMKELDKVPSAPVEDDQLEDLIASHKRSAK